MAFSIRCAEGGLDCPGQFTTETKEELMTHIQIHGEVQHPGLEIAPDDLDKLIKQA